MEKKMPFLLRFALLLCLATFSQPLWAKTAELIITPTRIVLDGNQRYATVNVKNSGDGTGHYRIELIDATMQEDGSVKLRDDGSRDPFSALDTLSISPRSMTLKADEYQTVRILVKNPDALQEGEVRSHLKVKMTENDLDANTGAPSKETAAIAIKPKLAMVIPIIVRRGQTDYHVTINDLKLEPGATTHADKNAAQLHITFGMNGNRSVLGDVKIIHVGGDGKETLIKFFPGVAIYRGTQKRELAVPLETPDGLNLRSGKIIVTYSAQEKENGKLMAQKEFTP